MSKITHANVDQKKLFKIVANLIHVDDDTPLLPCDNYRPVSNMPYLSKKIGVIVARLSAHISEYHLCEPILSAHKPNHSVEMALVFVQNDILRAVDNQNIVIVLLLDFSAAFDTVDHDAVSHRVSHDVGVFQTALDWFKSYLNNRVQSVHSHCSTSPASNLTCGSLKVLYSLRSCSLLALLRVGSLKVLYSIRSCSLLALLRVGPSGSCTLSVDVLC